MLFKKQKIMQTKEDLILIEETAHKIEGIADILFCYTEDFESGCPRTTQHTNTALKYLLEEIRKIIEVF